MLFYVSICKCYNTWEVQHLKSLILTRHKTTCSTEND
ncbi:hypothetical protein T03_10185 [Trichinella britovi]|uniref:Uncharacterized protein n=1 Tax=Trichinella britovi TaxID=45882 RepID=A0A0V0Z2L6_TRIBR|nr:hypothetical protein T03_10185 [Trichinella britovi]